MKLIYIMLFVQVTIMTFVRAQKHSSLSINKPVVDLKEKGVRITPKLPEHRRKSSIFPKNPQKYVVTSKPYAQIRAYTPRPTVMTKKTFTPVYTPSFTTKGPDSTRSSMRSLDSIVEWPREVPESRIYRRIIEEKHVNNNKGFIITQDVKGFETANQIMDDSEEISTDLPEFDEDVLTNELDNNIQVDFNTLSELDNLRIKRLAQHGPTVHDSWYFKNVARVPGLSHYANGDSHMAADEDEFIFLNNNHKNTPTKTELTAKSSRSMKSNDNGPKSNSVSALRSKRSNNNIIEEETRASTVSGFKLSHEPLLNSNLVFKNIHA